ncbi:hypothetical protein GBA52_028455 [Prunus armeniaca]|nr:hypothetical protein GBA52_028455 [Prunus armeniaca]
MCHYRQGWCGEVLLRPRWSFRSLPKEDRDKTLLKSGQGLERHHEAHCSTSSNDNITVKEDYSALGVFGNSGFGSSLLWLGWGWGWLIYARGEREGVGGREDGVVMAWASEGEMCVGNKVGMVEEKEEEEERIGAVEMVVWSWLVMAGGFGGSVRFFNYVF